MYKASALQSDSIAPEQPGPQMRGEQVEGATLKSIQLTWNESAIKLSVLLKSRMAALAPGLMTLLSS